MPKNKDAISRYRIIDAELRRGRPIKTSKIAEICSEKMGIPISNRTILKDIEDLKEDTGLGYYAEIKYNKIQKAHYYEKDAKKIFPTVVLSDEEINALLFYSKALSHYKNYTIFNNISEAIEKVLDGSNIPLNLREAFKTRSIFEAEKNLPIKGNELIKEIMIALIECKKIEFEYTKFESAGKRRKLTPILLKEDKQMWYVIGLIDGKEKPTTFALDRISNLLVTNENFTPIDFDPEEYFKHCFGITVPDEKPIKVTLSFNPNQGNYIKTLPIHETQKIIVDDEKEVRIEILVKPTYEFYSKILSYGSDVKLLSPSKISNVIKGKLTTTLENYKK